MSFSEFKQAAPDVIAKRVATQIAYYHHSNPSNPDSFTFFDKIIVRPELDAAKQNAETSAEAKQLVDLHGVYIDLSLIHI